MFKYFFLSLLWIALILSGCSWSWATENTNGTGEVDALRNSRPNRRADINGTVKTIVGNEFTIETLDMWSGMDFQFDREMIQAMTDSQRQEMMQKMQDARTNAKKVNVDVTIPVGIPIFVRTAVARGQWWFGGQARPGNPGWQAAWWLAATLWWWNNQNANRWWMGSGKQWTIEDIKKEYTIQIRLMTWSTDRKIAEWVSISQSAGWGFWAGFGGGQWWQWWQRN
jgi:hypothetical protein